MLEYAVMQCVNAMKRLKATYVNKTDAVIGEGGAATFLDISRVIFGLKLDLDVGNPIDPGEDTNVPSSGGGGGGGPTQFGQRTGWLAPPRFRLPS